MSELNNEALKPVPVFNREASIEFLSSLQARWLAQGIEGFIEVRTFPDRTRGYGESRFIPINGGVTDVIGGVNWAEKESARQRGVFYGANPRITNLGNQESVTTLVTSWIDLDVYKTDKTKQEAFDFTVNKAKIEASFVNDSGGGLQPLYCHDPVSHAEWLTTQLGLVAWHKDYGPDEPVSKDCARVLRLPGAPNWKQEQPRATSVVFESSNTLDHRSLKDAFVPTTKGLFAKSTEYQRQEFNTDVAAKQGRNTTVYKKLSSLRGLGVDFEDAVLIVENLAEEIGYGDDPDHTETVREMAERIFKKHEPNERTIDNNGSSSRVSDQDILTLLSRDRSADNLEREDKQPMPETILEGLPRQNIGLVVAQPDGAKSTFLRNLSNALASGTAMDSFVSAGQPRVVLLADFETNQEILKADMATMRSGMESESATLAKHNVHIYSKDRIEDELEDKGIFNRAFELTNEWAMDFLQTEAQRIKADVIIIDTVRSGHRLENENNNSEVEAMMGKFKKLARRCNAVVILAHHVGKYTDNNVKSGDTALWKFAGCGAWQGKNALSLHLFPIEEYGQSGVQVLYGKYKYKSLDESKRLPKDRTYQIHSVTRHFIQDIEMSEALQRASQGLDYDVLEYIKANQPLDESKGVKTATIVDALSDTGTEGRSRSSINDALASLLEDKRAVKLGRGFWRTID